MYFTPEVDMEVTEDVEETFDSVQVGNYVTEAGDDTGVENIAIEVGSDEVDSGYNIGADDVTSGDDVDSGNYAGSGNDAESSSDADSTNDADTSNDADSANDNILGEGTKPDSGTGLEDDLDVVGDLTSEYDEDKLLAEASNREDVADESRGQDSAAVGGQGGGNRGGSAGGGTSNVGWAAPEPEVIIVESPIDHITCEEPIDSLAFWGNYTIHQASIDIETTKFYETIMQIHDLTSQHNGFPENLSVDSWQNVFGQEDSTFGRWAVFTIRIPRENYLSMLNRIHEVGGITSLNIFAEDVSTRMLDMNSQMDELYVLEERVTELINYVDPENIALLDAAQGEINRQAQTLNAQQQALDGQIAYTTFNIFVTERIVETMLAPYEGSISEARAALNSSLSAMGVVGEWLLILLAFVLPWLALIGIIIATVMFIVRRQAKKGSLEGE
jgi:hypothetical protein